MDVEASEESPKTDGMCDLEERLPAVVRLLPKVHQYGLGIALCLYIVGFVITNMFLASFGAVSFDIVSTRYVLAGLMFGLFVAAVVLPLHGLFFQLVRRHGEPLGAIASHTLKYSVNTYIAIAAGVFAVQSISSLPAWMTLRSFVLFHPGWVRLLTLVVVSYLVSAVLILVGVVVARRTMAKRPADYRAEYAPLAGWANFYVWAVAVAIVVPLYGSQVYPYIPQQMGGGEPIRIAAVAAKPDVQKELARAGREIYLIDRTSGRTVFLCVDEKKKSRRVLEVNNSEVLSITHDL